MKKQSFDALLKSQNEHLNKLHEIVQQSIKEEDLIINRLQHPNEKLSFSQRLSDSIARFGGSWKFIITFGVVLFLWILVNAIFLGSKAFDPYPFILMNLILSCIAALQAPVIMMSQNRQEEKDRMRSENDYMVNLKAEIEIRSLQQKMDLLLEEQIKTLYDTQAAQFALLKEIDKKLNTLCGKEESRASNPESAH
jgi:uncharacterized membrane protein